MNRHRLRCQNQKCEQLRIVSEARNSDTKEAEFKKRRVRDVGFNTMRGGVWTSPRA